MFLVNDFNNSERCCYKVVLSFTYIPQLQVISNWEMQEVSKRFGILKNFVKNFCFEVRIPGRAVLICV